VKVRYQMSDINVGGSICECEKYKTCVDILNIMLTQGTLPGIL